MYLLVVFVVCRVTPQSRVEAGLVEVAARVGVDCHSDTGADLALAGHQVADHCDRDAEALGGFLSTFDALDVGAEQGVGLLHGSSLPHVARQRNPM